MPAHGLNYDTSDIHRALFSFPPPFRAATTFSSVPRIHRGSARSSPALDPSPAVLPAKNRSRPRDLVGRPGINAASNSVNEATSKLGRRSGRLNAGTASSILGSTRFLEGKREFSSAKGLPEEARGDAAISGKACLFRAFPSGSRKRDRESCFTGISSWLVFQV